MAETVLPELVQEIDGTAAGCESTPLKLILVDYHLQTTIPIKVPSREANALIPHCHGWLYRLAYGGARAMIDPNQRTAPFAAFMLSSSRRTSRPDHLSIRVCWYGDHFFHNATGVLANECTAILGGIPFSLAAIVPLSREPITYEDLLESATDAVSRIILRAITPVVFRRNSRTHVTLDPIDVLRSCEQRWETIWPGTLPVEADRTPYDRWHRIPTTELCAKTITRNCGEFKESGVLGTAEYDLRAIASNSNRRFAVSLFRAGEIFGVGARCAYGFGGITIEMKT